jgi:hypothetical protein
MGFATGPRHGDRINGEPCPDGIFQPEMDMDEGQRSGMFFGFDGKPDGIG